MNNWRAIRQSCHKSKVQKTQLIFLMSVCVALVSCSNPLQDFRDEIIGRWTFDDRLIAPSERFSRSELLFEQGGSLTVKDLTHYEFHTLHYMFLDGETIEVTGDGYDSKIHVWISGDKLQMSVYFRDQTFLKWDFEYTRIHDPYLRLPSETFSALTPSADTLRLNSVWATMKTPSDGDVKETGASVAYAVGDQGTVLRYDPDGEVWEQMNPPTSQDLKSIYGNSQQDIFAVGDGGVILHFDGLEWAKMDSGVPNNLLAIYTDPVVGVFAVGSGPTVLQLTDGIWKRVDVSTLAPELQPFDVITITAHGTFLFVGGTKGVLEYFDGREWYKLRVIYQAPQDLMALASLGEDDAVLSLWGQHNRYLASTQSKYLMTFNESYWQAIDFSTAGFTLFNPIRSVWGNDDSLFMVGERGLMIHSNADRTMLLAKATGENLYSVSGNAELVIAVGDNATLLQCTDCTEQGHFVFTKPTIKWLNE